MSKFIWELIYILLYATFKLLERKESKLELWVFNLNNVIIELYTFLQELLKIIWASI